MPQPMAGNPPPKPELTKTEVSTTKKWSCTLAELEPRVMMDATLVDFITSGDSDIFLQDASDALAAFLAQDGLSIASPHPIELSHLNDSAQQRIEVVFLDERVGDLDAWLREANEGDGLSERVFHVLDAERDGFLQIETLLATLNQPVDALHFVSHGSSQGLQLGSTWLDASEAQARQLELANWSRYLTEDADLLFYSCQLAEGAEGRELLGNLSRMAAADVAASSDLTGNSSFGGNWALEFALGQIESTTLSAMSENGEWQGTLNLVAAGGEVAINGSTTGVQQTSAAAGGNVATDASGNYVVVWEDHRDGNPEIYAKVYNADGSLRTGDFKVHTSLASNQTNAGVAMDDLGRFVVSWRDDRSAANEIYMRVFDASGTALSGEIDVTALAGAQQQHSIDIGNDGTIVVAFQSDSDTDIYFQRFNLSGTALGSTTKVNSATSNIQTAPDVSVADDGSFVVVWESEFGGSNYGVRGRRFDASGAALTSDFSVNSYTPDFQGNPSVDHDAAGNFVIVYQSQGQDGSNLGVYARRYDASATALGSEFRVNVQTSGDQWNPHVDMNAAGDFVITWNSTNQDGSGEGIYAQQFDRSGNRIAGEVLINSTTTGSQTTPSVAVASSSAIVVWSGQGTGDTSGVWSQRFQFTDVTSFSVTTANDTVDGDTSSIAALLNSRGADSQISLREALTAANNTLNGYGGADHIQFAIAGVGVQTITIAGSDLPTLTQAIVIDGTSQTGFAGSPLIAIASDGSRQYGFQLGAGSSGSQLRGLIVQGFQTAGINVLSSNNLVAGNWIGLSSDGAAAAGNGYGIRIAGASSNVIGGTSAADRNVVSGNSQAGIFLDNATATVVQGNFIGTDISGIAALGNGGDGILISNGSSGNTVGGTASGAGNVIAFNGRDGIRVDSTAGNGNLISSNSIHSNAALGINLVGGSEDAFGATQNDNLDADTGANGLQNHPQIDSAGIIGDELRIAGTFHGEAGRTIRLEFFASPTADASGYGEGRYVLGSVDVVTDGSGNVSFNETLSSLGIAVGDAISMTATDLSSGNTSEFSVAVAATALNIAPYALRAMSTRQGGLQLNNDGGNSAYLVADDGASLLGGLSSLTFETQFNSTTIPSAGAVLLSYATAAFDNAVLVEVMPTGELRLRINDAGIGTTAYDYSQLFDGADHQFSLTWSNAGGGTWQVFVDGALVDSGVGLASGATIATGGTLVFGQEQDAVDGGYNPDQNFRGTLFNIRLFSAVRSAAEILAGSAVAVPYDTNSLLAQWDFGQLSESGVVFDQVSGNDLTLQEITGGGFVDGTPDVTFSLAEGSAAGTVVGVFQGQDENREAIIAQLLAADANLRYSAETGKFYKLVYTANNWTNAQSASNGTVLSGISGRLVTIGSAHENSLVQGFANEIGNDVWLGYSDQISEGNWQRYSGDGAGQVVWHGGLSGQHADQAFVNWRSGEPNDQAGEDYAVMYRSDGSWNDLNGSTTRRYIIEWNADEVLSVSHPLSYSIVSQTVDGAFAIDPDNGQLVVADGTLLDYETNPLHSLVIRVSDGEFSYDQVFTIGLTDQTLEPSATIPSPQIAPRDGILEFSTALGNAITVSDQQVGDQGMLQVQLSASNGILFLSQTTGLSFVEGSDGSASMVIYGSEAALNAALDGLLFQPDPSYVGPADIQLDVSLNAGLEGLYQFTGGTANDLADGQPDDGSLVGQAAIGTDPEHGEVLQLDGDGDHVAINGLFGQPANVTLAGWVNLYDGDSSGGEVVSLGNNVFLRLDGGTGAIQAAFWNGSTFRVLEAPIVLAGDGWHHIAVTFDQINFQQRIYLDGTLVAESAFSGAIAYSRGSDTTIGAHGEGDPNFDFFGELDDIRVYSRALNADEIAAMIVDAPAISATVAIDVQWINQEQILAVNSGATFDENSTGNVIGPAMLETTDVDHLPSELTYTVTGAVSFGTLTLNGSNLGVGDTFTQQDINDGLLKYNHDGSENHADSFSFVVDDGLGTTSSGSFSLTINPINDQSPQVTTGGGAPIHAISVLENTTNVGALAATDGDLPTGVLQFSIAGGDDAGLFSIDPNTGDVSFNAPPDYDAPADSNADNVYQLIVQVTDQGGLFAQQEWQVTVDNVNEAGPTPIVDVDSNANQIQENSALGAPVGITAASADSDTLDVITYSLDDDAGGLFTINPATGVVVLNGALDRETAGATLLITVRATSSDGSHVTQSFSIDVIDQNEFAVGALSDTQAASNAIYDNAAIGASVGITASAIDADATNNTISYALLDDAGGRFSIDSISGTVTLAAANSLHATTAASHQIVVQALSADGSTSTRSFTIAVLKFNTAPVAVSDQFTMTQGGALWSVGSILSNDYDYHHDTLTAQLVTAPGSGTIVFLNDGEFIYSPHVSFIGTDQFAYVASDGQLNSAVTWVTIVVNPLPPLLTGNDDQSTVAAIIAELTRTNNDDQNDDADPFPAVTLLPSAQKSQNDVELEAQGLLAGTMRRDALDEETPAAARESLASLRNEGTGGNLIHWMALRGKGGGTRLVNDIGLRSSATFETPMEMMEAFAQLKQDVGQDSLFGDWSLRKPAVVTSMGVAAGYLIWSLRGVFLTATFFSSLPAWRFIDPLPVLDRESSRCQRERADSESNLAGIWRD